VILFYDIKKRGERREGREGLSPSADSALTDHCSIIKESKEWKEFIGVTDI
jgi:hypothetical protein